MRYFKWVRAAIIAGLVFFAVPQNLSADTFTELQTAEYVNIASAYPLAQGGIVDRYLGNTMSVSFGSFFHHLRDFFTDTIPDGFKTVGDKLEDAGIATGDFIASHPVMIGLIAASLVLAIPTFEVGDSFIMVDVGDDLADAVAAASEGGADAAGGATEDALDAAISSDLNEASGADTTSIASGQASEPATNVVNATVNAIEDTTNAEMTSATAAEADATAETAEEGALDAEEGTLTPEEQAEQGTEASTSTTAEDNSQLLTKVTNTVKYAHRVYQWYLRGEIVTAIAMLIKEKNFKEALAKTYELHHEVNEGATPDPKLISSAFTKQLVALQSALQSGNPSPQQLQTLTQDLQSQTTLNMNNALGGLPAGTNAQILSSGVQLINQSSLPATAQASLTAWLSNNTSKQDLAFLGPVIEFSQLYNAAQNNPNDTAAQTAYQQFVAKIPNATLGSIMQFAANNNVGSNPTALSNLGLFVAQPYQFYIAAQLQTGNFGSALSQMMQELNKLPSSLQQSTMAQFYNVAVQVNDPNLSQMLNYIGMNGAIVNSNVPNQGSVSTAQLNALSTAAQKAIIPNYSASNYFDNTDTAISNSNLFALASSIPPIAGTSIASVQQGIANSSYAAGNYTQGQLNSLLDQNQANSGAVNALAAALKFANLYNAAYTAPSSSDNLSAKQNFTNYVNQLSPASVVTMMNFTYDNGLVPFGGPTSVQELLVTPDYYLSNQEYNKPSQYSNLSPGQYAIYSLYTATQGWNQAQIKSLISRAYYGLVNDIAQASQNGMNVTPWANMLTALQKYTTPDGTFQNNPQDIIKNALAPAQNNLTSINLASTNIMNSQQPQTTVGATNNSNQSMPNEKEMPSTNNSTPLAAQGMAQGAGW